MIFSPQIFFSIFVMYEYAPEDLANFGYRTDLKVEKKQKWTTLQCKIGKNLVQVVIEGELELVTLGNGSPVSPFCFHNSEATN
jgi:hypothetical protein